jgi:DNA-binding transcriptional MerR regulator
VSERPYLSIGEVLGLLLEEFPDVTISKIRFLEAQGLIDPERTSSGYRKFYDNDVERLRFILREQKDNYLPLKVIKDRLDLIDHTLPNPPRPIPMGASWLTAPGDEESVVAARPAGYPDSDDGSPQFDWSQLRPQREEAEVSAGRVAPQHVVEVVEQPAAAPTAAQRPAAVQPVVSVSVPGAKPAPPATAAPRPPSRPHESANHTPTPVRTESPSPVAQQPAAATPAVRPASPAPAREPIKNDAPTHPEPAAVAPVARQPLAVVPSIVADIETTEVGLAAGEVHVELTAEELCVQASINAALLKELESFGLVTARLVSGLSVYGLDALRIATAAGRLAEHGLEPRHLRAWRTSVDREISLIEQLVQPLLRQRNPQSRVQAAKRADEISRLGGELRNALVRMGIHALIES